MSTFNIPVPRFEEAFSIDIKVDKPVVVGQGNIHGRRSFVQFIA